MTSNAPLRDGDGTVTPAHQPIAVLPARPQPAPNEQDETDTILAQMHQAVRASDNALRCSAEAYEASARALVRRPAAARRHRVLASEYRRRIST